MAKKSQYKQKLEYNNNYNRNNYRSFSVRFNNKVEKTVIAWLEAKDSVKGYLCDLIIADMEKNGKKNIYICVRVCICSLGACMLSC